MRKTVRSVVAFAILFSAATAFVQSQGAPLPQQPAFRLPFDLKLKIDKGHYYEEHFADIPFVADSDVYLFAGESFGINVTVVDGKITGVTYQPDTAKCDVSFKFSQEKLKKDEMMMMLTTRNGLKGRLLFDALMTIPGKKGIFKTSILPVEPGLSNFESWPHPIVQLVLRNFRFVENSTATQH